MTEALSRHDLPDAETICRMLRSPEIRESWLEISLIDLAGERRIPEAVPALVDKFQVDTDYMLEQCKEALAKIGDPEAARLIRAAYPEVPEHFQNYTTDVIGAIKHPESEDILLDLLQIEEDLTFRTFLCVGLCDLFSERGIEAVKSEIVAGYDTFYTTLEDHLLPVATALGIELPEADRWKARARGGGTSAREEARRDGATRPTFPGDAGEGDRPLREARGGRSPEATAPHRRCRPPHRRPRSDGPGRRSAATIPVPAAAARSTRSAAGSRVIPEVAARCQGRPARIMVIPSGGRDSRGEFAPGPRRSGLRRSKRGVAGRSRPPAGSPLRAGRRASCRAACAPSPSARRP